jgi:DNA-binding NtrC family response regulator
MFLRPCFLVVDQEFAGSISTRKLVLETAKFNVITAYSYAEARATLDIFPNVDACVVNGHSDDKAEQVLRHIEAAHPTVKRVLIGDRTNVHTSVDLHVETYSPEALLLGLRKLFPEDAAKAESIERKLEESTPPAEE